LAYPFHDVIVIPGDETLNFRNLALGPGVRLDAIVSDLDRAVYVNATHQLKIWELRSMPSQCGGDGEGDPNGIAR